MIKAMVCLLAYSFLFFTPSATAKTNRSFSGELEFSADWNDSAARSLHKEGYAAAIIANYVGAALALVGAALHCYDSQKRIVMGLKISATALILISAGVKSALWFTMESVETIGLYQTDE